MSSMSLSGRSPRRRWIAAAATALVLTAPTLPAGWAAPVGPRAAMVISGDRVVAGPTGPAIVVDDHVELSGFDLATDSDGTSYLGWISSTGSSLRKVHLCVLPVAATACSGGVLTDDLTDTSSSAGLRVVTTGPGSVTLVWFHDTAASQTGPNGAKLATATYSSGVLSAAADQSDAPSYGSLLDVARDGTGAIWAVLSDGPASPTIQVRQGLSGTPVSLTAPWAVNDAWLAFAGSTPVLAVDRAGSIIEPVRYATLGASWSSFTQVPNTWNVGGAVGIVGTSRGVRLIASEANAGYRPVVSVFSSGHFGTPKLVGDRNSCSPTSHDLVTDVSGRVADVSNECGQITLANLPNTTQAGIVRFSAGGTVVAGGPPQITTTGRGHGWVAFSIESTSANKLKVVPVMLPALTTTKRKTGAAGRVTVRGPVSCLPAVQSPARVTAKPSSGWKLKSKSLKLDGKVLSGSSINGAALLAGSGHSLTGAAKFTKPGHSPATVKVTLKFKACPGS